MRRMVWQRWLGRRHSGNEEEEGVAVTRRRILNS